MHFFLSFLIGVVLFYSFRYFPYSTVFFSFIGVLVLCIRKKYLLVTMLLAGTVFALLRYEIPVSVPPVKYAMTVKGIFTGTPVHTRDGIFRQTFTVASVSLPHADEPVRELEGKDMVLFSDREFALDTVYELEVKPLRGRERYNPGGLSNSQIAADVLAVRETGKAGGSLYSKLQGYRHSINKYIEGHFKRDSGALVASVTTGQTTDMSEELREAFSITGMAHILSISGTHFGLFSVFLFGLFRLFITHLPYKMLQRISLYITPSQAAALFSLPFMLAYLGLSGSSIPAVRSFFMITLVLLGLVIGRKGFWLTSLLFAAFVLVVWDPQSLFSLSFQLSFLAVLFIGFSVGEKDEEPLQGRRYVRYIRNALSLTVWVLIGTAPLVAYVFHYFPVISPLSNLVIAPLIGFLLIPLSVLSSFLYLITGHFIFTPIISAVADMSIEAVTLFSRIPFADIRIPAFPPGLLLLYYAGFVLFVLFEKKKYLLILPFLPLVIFTLISLSEKSALRVTFLDVGQGDSSVVELPDGNTMVIDTGLHGREAAAFLKFRGKKSIDVLLLSHRHPDHTGGAEHLADRYEIKELWHSGRLVLPALFDRIPQRSLARGDMIEGEGYTVYVLHPYPEFYTRRGSEYDAANNDSLVVKIAGTHMSVLLAGDIEEEAEENILHLGTWAQSSVIKVPHHGGKTSAYGPFFHAVSPQYAVISAGRDNSFGHPHQELLDALQGISIARTDLDGAVAIRETSSGLEMKTFRDFQFKEARSFGDELMNIRRLFASW